MDDGEKKRKYEVKQKRTEWKHGGKPVGCPWCEAPVFQSKVLNAVTVPGGPKRRIRICAVCGRRYATVEVLHSQHPELRDDTE